MKDCLVRLFSICSQIEADYSLLVANLTGPGARFAQPAFQAAWSCAMIPAVTQDLRRLPMIRRQLIQEIILPYAAFALLGAAAPVLGGDAAFRHSIDDGLAKCLEAAARVAARDEVFLGDRPNGAPILIDCRSPPPCGSRSSTAQGTPISDMPATRPGSATS